MKDMFLTVLNMSLSASVVILAVLAARLVLRQAPKKWSYLLWAVVGFRLCCPVSLESVLSIFRAAPVKPTVSQVAPVGQAPASAIQYIPRTVTALPVAPVTNTGTVPSVPAVSPAVTAPAAPGAVTAQVWLVAAIALWVVGMAALLLYAVVSYLELKGSLTTATRLEGNVYEADGIRSPFILGLFRPKIYIPYGLDPSTLGYVLDHERYHIRRGDHIWKTLAYILLAVHWFNPLVWLSFHLMGKDMEMSCDEKVLGRGGNIRREYSTTLLSFATERRFPAAAPLAFGETAVKTRIKNALNWKRPKTWATLLSALLCIALVVSCAVNPTVESPADPPEASGAPVVTDSPSPSPVAESPVPVMMQVTIPVDWVAGLVEEESYVNRVSLYERQSREDFRADFEKDRDYWKDWENADQVGMGWLCTIARVDADTAREIREMDSGGAIFAEDGKGAYYAFYYPTDVRLYRAGGDISEDADLWSELNEWAWTLPGAFLAQHPELMAFDSFAEGRTVGFDTSEFGTLPELLSHLRAEDIGHISGYGMAQEPSAEAVAPLLREAPDFTVDHPGLTLNGSDTDIVWALTLYLGGSLTEGWSDSDALTLQAGIEEGIVEIFGGKNLPQGRLVVNDKALYWFLRDIFVVPDRVDQTAYMKYHEAVASVYNGRLAAYQKVWPKINGWTLIQFELAGERPELGIGAYQMNGALIGAPQDIIHTVAGGAYVDGELRLVGIDWKYCYLAVVDGESAGAFYTEAPLDMGQFTTRQEFLDFLESNRNAGG